MPHTFIFIGRSGCGKGTQAQFLVDELKERGDAPVFYLESGARFREFVGYDNATARRAKEMMERSLRQPDFLAVWMWSHLLVEGVHGREHWVIDGTPRSLIEAQVLDTAFGFYERERPTVVHIAVSRAWSEARLHARGRTDDSRRGDIEQRMAWFERDVVPAVEWYRAHQGYRFIEVNGEQTVEEVWQDLKENIR